MNKPVIKIYKKEEIEELNEGFFTQVASNVTGTDVRQSIGKLESTFSVISGTYQNLNAAEANLRKNLGEVENALKEIDKLEKNVPTAQPQKSVKESVNYFKKYLLKEAEAEEVVKKATSAVETANKQLDQATDPQNKDQTVTTDTATKSIQDLAPIRAKLEELKGNLSNLISMIPALKTEMIQVSTAMRTGIDSLNKELSKVKAGDSKGYEKVADLISKELAPKLKSYSDEYNQFFSSAGLIDDVAKNVQEVSNLSTKIQTASKINIPNLMTSIAANMSPIVKLGVAVGSAFALIGFGNVVTAAGAVFSALSSMPLFAQATTAVVTGVAASAAGSALKKEQEKAKEQATKDNTGKPLKISGLGVVPFEIPSGKSLKKGTETIATFTNKDGVWSFKVGNSPETPIKDGEKFILKIDGDDYEFVTKYPKSGLGESVYYYDTRTPFEILKEERKYLTV